MVSYRTILLKSFNKLHKINFRTIEKHFSFGFTASSFEDLTVQQNANIGIWLLTSHPHPNPSAKSVHSRGFVLNMVFKNAMKCKRLDLITRLKPVVEGAAFTIHTRACANRNSNPEAVRLGDSTYCLHKPECIVITTNLQIGFNHDYKMTVLTSTHEF